MTSGMAARAFASLLGALLLLGCSERQEPTAEAPATLHTIHVGATPIQVRYATTDAERRRGLMRVASLGPDEGMLFVYSEPGIRTMWMKNCLIALDIAFADDAGRIFQLETLQPPTETGNRVEQVWSTREARYVLEMPAGWFARNRHGIGTRLDLGARPEASR